MIFGLSIGVLVYAAFVFDFFGFLARDELLLRLLMLAASALYLFYYYLVAGDPLWDAIITNGALGAVNLMMIFVVITERTTFSMSAAMTELYRMFPLLSPGQFRKLHRLADHGKAETGRVLTTEGEHLDRLYFISHGSVDVEKGGEVVPVPAPAFIGEIAFITNNPASATVRTREETQMISWDHATLESLFRQRPALKVAVSALLNTDLAHKVAKSRPMVSS